MKLESTCMTNTASDFFHLWFNMEPFKPDEQYSIALALHYNSIEVNKVERFYSMLTWSWQKESTGT